MIIIGVEGDQVRQATGALLNNKGYNFVLINSPREVAAYLNPNAAVVAILDEKLIDKSDAKLAEFLGKAVEQQLLGIVVREESDQFRDTDLKWPFVSKVRTNAAAPDLVRAALIQTSRLPKFDPGSVPAEVPAAKPRISSTAVQAAPMRETGRSKIESQSAFAPGAEEDSPWDLIGDPEEAAVAMPSPSLSGLSMEAAASNAPQFHGDPGAPDNTADFSQEEFAVAMEEEAAPPAPPPGPPVLEQGDVDHSGMSWDVFAASASQPNAPGYGLDLTTGQTGVGQAVKVDLGKCNFCAAERLSMNDLQCRFCGQLY
ncbi:MAG: hypothetical protein GMKNLPBB_03263 [Myxococcota bacterium]|nr:hypothetical protein [Myxococcota bacterium]